MKRITYEVLSIRSIVHLEEFVLDRFQPERVDKIVEKFQEERMKPGEVWRREDGVCVSLDGKHTDEAALRCGFEERMYKVIDNMTYEEACIHFAEQHDLEMKQHPSKVFDLMARAGRSPEREIKELLGGRLGVRGRGGRSLGVSYLSTPTPLKRTYRLYGPEILDETIQFTGVDWRPTSTVTAPIFLGASELFVRATGFDPEILVRAVQDQSQMKVDADARATLTKRAAHLGLGIPTAGSSRQVQQGLAVAEILADLYNEEAVRSGKKKIIIIGKRADERVKKHRKSVSDSRD